MSSPLRQIPQDLLDPWYDRFENLWLVPAFPRQSRKWSISFGFVSIYLGYGDYGYAQVVPENAEELYIFYLFVSPSHRRKGYGTKQMRRIIKIAEAIGYKRISLDVGYLDLKDKVPAKVLRSFYKSLGFVNDKGSKMILYLPKEDRKAA